MICGLQWFKNKNSLVNQFITLRKN